MMKDYKEISSEDERAWELSKEKVAWEGWLVGSIFVSTLLFFALDLYHVIFYP